MDDAGAPQIDTIFEQCLGRTEAEWRAAFEDACARFPAHADELRRRWSLLSGIGGGAGEPAAAAATAPARRDRLGKFRLIRQLGAGGMGVVWLAEDESLGRRVALKLIRAEFLAFDKARTRFRREVEAASQIDEPGICTVYEAGEIDGQPFLSMRYVEGETLEQRIDARESDARGADARRPATDTARQRILADAGVIERAARSLHVAHEHGLVHRDIKPGNIMLTPDGAPVILDFGLCRLDREGAAGLTMSGELLGTPAYMAPEQIEPRGRLVDRRADVYALGVTLYECLTSKRPFDAHSLEALSRKILRGDATRITKLEPRVPRDLAIVIATAMDKDPARRYSTALELADELARVRGFEPIRARPAGPLLRLRRWSQRNPVVATALSLLSVSLGAVTWLWAVNRDALAANLRLGDEYRLQRHREDAARLWPAREELVPAMAGWLAATADLPQVLTFHEDRLSREAAGELDDAGRWIREHRARLVGELRAFLTDPDTEGSVPDVERRLAAARTLRARSIERYRDRWREAIAQVGGSDAYGGLVLREQTGLVPLGPDPDSRLQEFAHLPSGEVPVRDPATGRLVLEPASGLVFVLIPGGAFVMGAKGCAPGESGPNLDPQAEPDESPAAGALPRVELDPFLLSKYEMTEAQWQRVRGSNPSYNGDGDPAGFALHPVQMVNFVETVETLRRLGLELPTEAQWEYAARGGTGTPRFTDAAGLPVGQCINLADRAFAAARVGSEAEAGIDDGFALHAPVDALVPNPFGLCHVLGNVMEWCADWYDERRLLPLRPGTGAVATDEDLGYRCYRGASYWQTLANVRVTRRWCHTPDHSSPLIGVRPVHPLGR